MEKTHENALSITRRRLLADAAVASAAMALPMPWLRSALAESARYVGGVWSPVPLVSKKIRQELRDRGLPDLGGEGGQWIRSLAFGPDGKTAIWGTDVGGLYRTLDAGQTWEPCNVGYVPRGTSTIAFDPRDATRIVAVGANSMADEKHGIYLSTDRGASWRHVLPAKYSGIHDWRHQVAFDPTSDRVYWSRVAKDKTNYGEGVDEPALYVSDDRGATWRRIDNSEHLGGAILTHHPKQPILFLAAPDGVYTLRGGATEATKVSDRVLTGLDCSPAMPDRLIATTAKDVLRSTDGGENWESAAGVKSVVHDDSTFQSLRVSPADGDRFGFWHERPDWQWSRVVSHDGGRSFVTSKHDDSLNFFPRNVRQARFAWHPTDPDKVLAAGGDWPTASDDGGKTFRWSGGGVNAVYSATAFQFCPHDPDVLMFSSQDYNGAFTTDGGATWTYAAASGLEWGGFTYGAASADARTHWAGLSTGGWGNPRKLVSTVDAGKTWTVREDIAWTQTDVAFGHDTCFCDPGDADVRFAGCWRSEDGGKTWAKMAGCHGVWSAADGMLFGGERRGDDYFTVVSRDGGATWTRIAAIGPMDCAYDPSRDRLHITGGNKVHRLNGVKKALASGTMIEPREVRLPDVPGGLWTNELHGVAVDPQRPEVVYACRHSNVFRHPAAVVRSTDAGETWHVITRLEPLTPGERDPQNLDGAGEAMRVRVHPVTGEAWFTTGCYGIWKWTPNA
jgi:photosystem II stability/assembly factor-like uncharacterized protein